MNFNTVEFKASYATPDQIPLSLRPEIVFAGRSNVGKSSLLNRLFNRKRLAKVSQTPGKTAAVNFFTAEDADFVDLPGYGFAKVSKAEIARWRRLMSAYFESDRRFALVVSLVDIRHPATALDVQMIEFLIRYDLPFVIVLTKADKLSRSKAFSAVSALRRQLGLGADIPVIACSSEKGTGIDALKALMQDSVRNEKASRRL
ncbi:ribosome biogenesis GTP-binding protein YihA/YsxC [Slackia exigua]|uniref:ribosome biogenesis GTP-binding protein YihA/YsxC n=1 Tax=Slackia exigua TaxID=84109 RepID=UPI002108A326|nr:ribosome biogenesis GTP-binding protein YihA/YsxC [Slackia exigua]MCQ5091408.1 ribosome biogenesis GTP-binding protein YihA/YsxC [Slackia exigua]